MQVPNGSRTEHSAEARRELGRRNGVGIARAVAAWAAAVVAAVVVARMEAANIADLATGHRQSQGQHHFVGSEVLCLRTAVVVAVAALGGAVDAAAGISEPSPVAIDDATAKPRETDDFRC
jgi:1-aminocyclopropane-1-carboxylate deaminase/D-cysteine desulfhydrase-like pyridoxal-dependent ACC family enzyme